MCVSNEALHAKLHVRLYVYLPLVSITANYIVHHAWSEGESPYLNDSVRQSSRHVLTDRYTDKGRSLRCKGACLAENCMASSFKKRAPSKPSYPRGTRPSFHNSALLLSTGVPSLDVVLGAWLSSCTRTHTH